MIQSTEIKKILKQSKRIAVVGLSNKPNRTSYQVANYMLQAGYTIIPVNPTVDEVFGIKAVPTLKDVDGPIDIVNVFRRSEALLEVAKDTVDVQAKVFWAQLGLYHQEAESYLAKHHVPTIMNQCIKVAHQQYI
ncbi:CoA-binding protein [Terrilactibacillus sp. BCM23-1]|uniref:CoA-binding protein n=1 Tax=Terrilactibacillus tamarindi TaxID=2599694 RepID=A0A6N8CUE0_9BACI|nr:CoA-binding protein [Terrilactibacillus tamarindi]MTT32927.1 CoA-binding protein [Terrilactibacillus tamarindi]